MKREGSASSRRTSARVIDMTRALEVNLVNVADNQRVDPGDRIIEVHSPLVRGTAMILTTVKDGRLEVIVYDTAGPVDVFIQGAKS